LITIATIVGARPQFIKAAVISRCIRTKYSDQIREIIIHSGQHYDVMMSDVFFEQSSIPAPDYNLQINGLSHGAMTGLMLEKIESLLLKIKPDWVLVYGDTNTTLAGALAAKKIGIKVSHIESGLRSFNMRMPEEINRILTDRISDILFCPTEMSISNLYQEGFRNFGVRIINSGDVMFDAALFYASKATPPSFKVPKNYVLSTIHRAENTDEIEKLESIVNSLNSISSKIPVILPIHPRTKKIILSHNITINPNLHIVDPVGYLEMIYLLKNCSLVITDSGGLQKEAFFFKKFCLTIRDETEWIELVSNGYNIVVGTDFQKILAGVAIGLDNKIDFDKSLYGNGNAADTILGVLLSE
jgi:UDP-GlcNAc3NAcA epimerase